MFQNIQNMRLIEIIFPKNTNIPTFDHNSGGNLANENNYEYLYSQNFDYFNDYLNFCSKDWYYDDFFHKLEINEEINMNNMNLDTLPQMSISDDNKKKFELNKCIISNENSFMYTPQKNMGETVSSHEKNGILGIKRKRPKHHKQKSKNTNTEVNDGNIKENKIKKETPTKKKDDNGNIENNANIDDSLGPTEIFNILHKLEALFKKDDKYNNFINFLKAKKLEYYFENKSSIIEIDETKEENISAYNTAVNKKSVEKKNKAYEEIIRKLIKLIRIITKPSKKKKGKNTKNENYNGGYLGINNENLNELIDQNILNFQNNGKNQLSEIKKDCIMTSTKENSNILQNPVKERKENLFYVFKTWVINSFINDFNNINKYYQIKRKKANEENEEKTINEDNINTTKQLKIECEKEFLIKSFEDFVNKGCRKIYLVDPKNIKGKEESDDAEKLMKLTKIKYIKEKLDIKKFLKEDEVKKISKYQNEKCRNILKELYANKDLKGLIILNKFLKLDNNGHIRINKKDEFKSAIKDLYDNNIFDIDLTEEEKDDIKNRKNILNEIFEDSLSFLDGRKRGRKRGSKKDSEKVAKKNK